MSDYYSAQVCLVAVLLGFPTALSALAFLTGHGDAGFWIAFWTGFVVVGGGVDISTCDHDCMCEGVS